MTGRPENVRLVLSARLNELESMCLHINCGSCPHEGVVYPLKALAMKIGPLHQLGAVIPRLVCKYCKAKPATIILGENHILNFCHGAPPGWSIQLHPLDG